MDEVVYVHSLLFVTDAMQDCLTDVGSDWACLHNFEVWIGSNPTYHLNTKCGNFGSETTRGAEAWCNLKGDYIFLVKTGLGSKWKSVICTLGIFGTIYERDANHPPASQAVDAGVTSSISINHIKSRATVAISNDLDIEMRQKAVSSIPWVSITNDAAKATVTFAYPCTGTFENPPSSSFNL